VWLWDVVWVVKRKVKYRLSVVSVLFVYFLDAFNCQSSIQGTTEVYPRGKYQNQSGTPGHRLSLISPSRLLDQRAVYYNHTYSYTYTMPPKAESSTAYRGPTVQDDDDDDFDDLDGKHTS
jgi:hypothetical protein